MAFFINRKKELLFFSIHLDLLLIGMKLELGLVHQPKIFRLFQQLEQTVGFGLPDFHAIKQAADLAFGQFAILHVGAILRMHFLQQTFSLGKVTIAEALLSLKKRVDLRLELGPPYALVRGGWKKDTVKIGDKITVEGAALAKDPKNHWAGALPTTFLVLPSGDKLPMR